MNCCFDHVRIPVRAFIESVRRIDLHVHDVIAGRHAGDVDPLAAELFEISIRPASCDPLKGTDVTAALVVVGVFEQVFQTERLFMSHRRNRPIHVQQLVIGKTADVIVHVARRIDEY